MNSYGYFVSGFESRGLPPRLGEDSRSRHLDVPGVRAALAVRHFHFDPRMRVDPPEAFNGAGQHHGFGPVKPGHRVVRPGGGGDPKSDQTSENTQQSFHKFLLSGRS